jgi:hypothetical protein
LPRNIPPRNILSSTFSPREKQKKRRGSYGIHSGPRRYYRYCVRQTRATGDGRLYGFSYTRGDVDIAPHGNTGNAGVARNAPTSLPHQLH